MKWEPVAAMIALLALGIWVVWSPGARHDTRPGAQLSKYTLGGSKGEVESLRGPDGTYSFRLLYRGGSASPVLTADEYKRIFGEEGYHAAIATGGSSLFRALNVTSWAGVLWVVLGFAGQGAFFGRMWIQWLASEKSKQSVVPEAFWWLSLVGGVLLFAYFAWRQDIVGVMGQTSGVVIYARNIRLIHKHRRRSERDAARAAAADSSDAPSITDDADPEPVLVEGMSDDAPSDHRSSRRPVGVR